MEKQNYNYQFVIAVISFCAVVLSAGTLITALKIGTVPEELATVTVSAFGVLGSLLVPTPNQNPRK